MNYIVMDLEWNQPLSKQRMVRRPIRLSGEIIQFGAVKIDNLEDLNAIDQYSEIVKPVFYPKMNRIVTEVTDITDEVIQGGRPFETVCREFLQWCGENAETGDEGEKYAFITWSENDILMLEDNMLIYDMDIETLPECYNVQILFDDQITQDNRPFALNYAMWKFGIKPERTHDALNDAINTVAVMRKLDFSEGLEGYEV